MAYGGGGNFYTLGGSFTTSCLDDIPFKLGPKFVPPTKVVLPPNIDLKSRSTSTALNEQYTFEVEEAVLKWSAERERQQEEQRNELQRLAALKQSQRQSDGSSSDPDQGEDAKDSSSQPIYENHNTTSESMYENTGLLYPLPAPKPRVPRNTGNKTTTPASTSSNYTTVELPNPLIANISNAILKPTLINSDSSSNGDGETKLLENKSQSNHFDVSQFEGEDDPFDNMELKTINDMEELASVLKETTKLSPEPPANGVIPADNGVYVEQTVTDSVSPCTSIEQDGADTEQPLYENLDLKTNKNGHIAPSQDQPGIDLSKLPPVPPRRDLVGRSPPLPPICRQSVDTALSQQNNQSVNNNPFTNQQSVSNSVNVSEGESNYDNAVNLSPRSPFTANSETKCTISHKNPVKKPLRTFNYSRHNIEDGNEDNSDANTNNSAEDSYVNVLSKSTTESSSKGQFSVQFKNAQSSPNLNTQTQNVDSDSRNGSELNFVAQHFGKGEESVTNGRHLAAPARPVPAPRRTQSPPSRPSSQQSWNRYSPLPPPGINHSSPTPESDTQAPVPTGLKPSRPAPARPAVPPNPRRQTDTYSKLSTEARTAVDNLTSMGFDRDRVIRAVEKLGEDEKEVVEYLCLVDQLTEKGYNTLLVENALLIFQNSMNKASAYLELFTQMQELGFNGEKIKEALVNTDNDREKTLDILTATS